MQTFHDATNITLKKYYSEPHFIDYTTQPKTTKSYPHFYRRFFIDDYEELYFIKNFGKVTYEKSYGKDKVSLRSNPSAGGLYPCEIYIQIRAVKGLISGIYHYEPLENSLVLLHELTHDGIEYYMQQKQHVQKFTFLISCAYFRTSWKYSHRSIRYLLLDCGHQLGSIYAALILENLEANFDFDFEKQTLNELFCFEGFEFFLVSMKTSFYKEQTLKPLRAPLIQVSACDYQIREPFIEHFFAQSVQESTAEFQPINLFKDISKDALQNAIDTRRSTRAFKKEPLQKELFEKIFEDIFEFSLLYGIEIYFINNNIEGLKKGLYKNVTLLLEGDFEEKATHLALNQQLAGKSAVTLFFTAPPNSKYLQTTMICGFIAHIVYLKSIHFDIGCSAIGAYFDVECQKLLDTPNNILYLLAVGK